VTLISEAKTRIGDLVERVKQRRAANGAKGESDVASDSHVAGSREGSDGDDGKYVGRTGPDVAQDVEQSGAEARSEQRRLAR
jgi:hypothetical protein